MHDQGINQEMRRTGLKSEIISHRGGSFPWPENTLTAFRRTLLLPVEQAECDIHLSADGVPIVHHDATLERTTNGRGPLAALDLAAIRRLRIRGAGDEPVPTLTEVARLFAGQRMKLRIEIKTDPHSAVYKGIVPVVLAALDEAGARGNAIIICFQGPVVAEAWAAGGLAGAVWLVQPEGVRDLGGRAAAAAARALGVPAVDTNVRAADAAWVAALRGSGLQAGAWGADHEATIRKALALGLDAFATDDPELALELRASTS
jgi:glycerophosphoryl diester phosphodiesterase